MDTTPIEIFRGKQVAMKKFSLFFLAVVFFLLIIPAVKSEKSQTKSCSCQSGYSCSCSISFTNYITQGYSLNAAALYASVGGMMSMSISADGVSYTGGRMDVTTQAKDNSLTVLCSGSYTCYGFCPGAPTLSCSATFYWSEAPSTPPSFTIPPDDHSDNTNPTNLESSVNFTATATDPEGDYWRLVVCKTNNANNGACESGQQACVSSLVPSGSQASCLHSTTGESSETYTWYAFACDAGNLCSSNSNSNSPYNVNHLPTFTSVALNPNPVAAGQPLTFISIASDSDAYPNHDKVRLIVCKGAGATSSGCSSGGTWCIGELSDSNPTCTFNAYSFPSQLGVYNYYAYIYDEHNFFTSSQSGTFSIGKSQNKSCSCQSGYSCSCSISFTNYITQGSINAAALDASISSSYTSFPTNSISVDSVSYTGTHMDVTTQAKDNSLIVTCTGSGGTGGFMAPIRTLSCSATFYWSDFSCQGKPAGTPCSTCMSCDGSGNCAVPLPAGTLCDICNSVCDSSGNCISGGTGPYRMELWVNEPPGQISQVKECCSPIANFNCTVTYPQNPGVACPATGAYKGNAKTYQSSIFLSESGWSNLLTCLRCNNNGIREIGEPCDCGGGACNSQQLNYKTCANFDEYIGGTLGCRSTCEYNFTACTAFTCNNNGTRESGEPCDCGGGACNSQQLNYMTCSNFDEFASGTLSCDNICHYDTSKCESTSVKIPFFVGGTFNITGYKDYLNVFWDAAYITNPRQLAVNCTYYGKTQVQPCIPNPYIQNPGKGGCAVASPDYDYTQPNTITCRIYDPNDLSLGYNEY